MDATPLNLKRPECRCELAALVAKMMAKEPRRRFQEPKEVAQALMPFFKKGHLAFQSTEAEVSLVGQSIPNRLEPEAVTKPVQPPAKNTALVARKSSVARPSVPETKAKGPVDWPQPEQTGDGTPAIGPARRPAWLWPSLVVGVLVLGLFVAWGTGVSKMTTPNTAVVLKKRRRLRSTCTALRPSPAPARSWLLSMISTMVSQRIGPATAITAR